MAGDHRDAPTPHFSGVEMRPGPPPRKTKRPPSASPLTWCRPGDCLRHGDLPFRILLLQPPALDDDHPLEHAEAVRAMKLATAPVIRRPAFGLPDQRLGVADQGGSAPPGP